jgi:hypothetical protein
MTTATRIIVPLTTHELVAAYFEAGQRITASEAQSLNHATTYTRHFRTRMEQESVGAIGERAFAKWRGCYASDINTFHRKADAGPFYEIRSTSTQGGKLIVRANDDDLRAFVLCLVGLDGRVCIRGWCWGWEAKVEKYLCDPHGHRSAWFVPQEELHPMEALP